MAQQEHARGGFDFDLETETLGAPHWAAIGLASLTGLVPLSLFATQELRPFLLAGLGFFGLIGLVLLGLYRRLVYLAGIPFTFAQIAGWYVLDGNVTALAAVDKVAQVLLIALFAYLFVRDGRAGRPLF